MSGQADSVSGKSSAGEQATTNDRSALSLRQRLKVELKEVELSARAHVVLQNENIQFMEDLIQYSEDQLLSVPTCGRKTVEELRNLAKSYGFELGTNPTDYTNQKADTLTELDISPPALTKRLLVSDLDEETKAKLTLRVTELNLSARASNVLLTNGVEFVGDLIQRDDVDLMSLTNCGLKTVDEIHRRLDDLGLCLSTKIADWSKRVARENRSSRDLLRDSLTKSLRMKLANVKKGNSLESELAGILNSFVQGRNSEILLKFFGWSGGGARTLESVGNEYGVTRERIRQIASKASMHLRKNEFEVPWLNKAVALVRMRCPATVTSLAEALKSEGISKTAFNPSGLETACSEFGKAFEFSTIRIRGVELYVKDKDAQLTREFFKLCRRHTSSRGCANFESICDELEIKNDRRENFRKIATVGGLSFWLDSDRRWFISPHSTRNRIANIVAKVLHVCQAPDLADIRRALYRSRRLEVVPPLDVLSSLIDHLGIGIVTGKKVVAASHFPDAIESGSTEELFITLLRKHGPALGWDRLRRYCIDAGMNPITFGIYLSASPVLARVARGIYSLVGADIPPGMVEEIESEQNNSRHPVEWGWSARGTFWCAIRLTGQVLSSNSVRVPHAVAEIIEGEWKTLVAGSATGSELKCKNGFLWGFRRAFINTGAEEGDVCIFEFDTRRQTSSLILGDEELVDIWDRGDDQLPPAYATEREDTEDETPELS